MAVGAKKISNGDHELKVGGPPTRLRDDLVEAAGLL